MKRILLLGMAAGLLLAGCSDSGKTEKAVPDEQPSESPTGPNLVRGYLVGSGAAPHGDCKKILSPDYAVGLDKTTDEVLLLSIAQSFAKDSAENVRSRSIIIRDASGNELAEATTSERVKPVVAKRGRENDNCFFLSEYEVQVPRADSYTFSVKGLPGAPPPLSHADLEELEFQCDLHADADGALIAEFGCDDVGLDP